jgi:hypothetical protein
MAKRGRKPVIRQCSVCGVALSARLLRKHEPDCREKAAEAANAK